MPPSEPGPTTSNPLPRPDGIDERSLRLQAAAMSALLLAVVWLAVAGLAAAPIVRSFGWFAYQPLADTFFIPGLDPGPNNAVTLLAERMLQPACIVMAIAVTLFLWGALSPRTHPLNIVFERAIAPHLVPAREVHPLRPVRFAARIGFIITALGMLLHILGVPLALLIAAALAFVASFLKAAFGVCLGCHLSLLLTRAGLLGRSAGAPS